MANELAIIEIKGGRYLEAEKMFNKDLKKESTYDTFFGLGVCKLNLLLNAGRNVEEVIYCFEKSLQLVELDKKTEIQEQIMNLSINVLSQFKFLYKQLEEQKKVETANAIIGGAITLGAALIGSSNNANGFTQIASLAAAGAGVGVSLDGLQNLGKIPEIQEYIISTANEIITKSKLVLGDNHENFEKKLAELTLNNFDGLRAVNVENKVSFFKTINSDLSELQKNYAISDEDFLRMSELASKIQTISFKNFKENEEYKRQWEIFITKYNISFLKKGDLLMKLKKNPIH